MQYYRKYLTYIEIDVIIYISIDLSLYLLGYKTIIF